MIKRTYEETFINLNKRLLDKTFKKDNIKTILKIYNCIIIDQTNSSFTILHEDSRKKIQIHFIKESVNNRFNQADYKIILVKPLAELETVSDNEISKTVKKLQEKNNFKKEQEIKLKNIGELY